MKPLVRTRGWKAVAAGSKALHVGGPRRVGRALAAAGDVALGRRRAAARARSGDRARELPRVRRRRRRDRGRVHWTQDPHVPRAARATAPRSRSSSCPTSRRSAATCSPGSGCGASRRPTSSATSAGRLHLLEVNPRFNLWHHPAAVAGVNLPALVHADLTGAPRPSGRRATRRVDVVHAARPTCAPRTRPACRRCRWLRWARALRRDVEPLARRPAAVPARHAVVAPSGGACPSAATPTDALRRHRRRARQPPRARGGARLPGGPEGGPVPLRRRPRRLRPASERVRAPRARPRRRPAWPATTT